MKIKIISNKEQLNDFVKSDSVDESERFIHLSFRPSFRNITALYGKCGSLKFVHLSYSNKGSLSKKAANFLKEHGIALLQGREIWGKRAEYFEIDLNGVSDISENYDDDGNVRLNDVTDEIKEKLGLENDLADYVIQTEIFTSMTAEGFEKFKKTMTETKV